MVVLHNCNSHSLEFVVETRILEMKIKNRRIKFSVEKNRQAYFFSMKIKFEYTYYTVTHEGLRCTEYSCSCLVQK